MRARHTITSFFFLLLLAAPPLFLSFLQAKQLYIKHTLEERLEAHLLKTFFIPDAEWQPLNRREILVANKMFDLKEVRPEKGGFTVTGVFDEDETVVHQQIAKACTASDSKDAPVFARFFQLLHGLFCYTAEPTAMVAAGGNKLFQNPIVLLPLIYRQVFSPPPQPLL